jgi:hypothetical protein
VTLCGPTLPSLVCYRSGVDAELLHHEVHDRRLDFATFWKSSVRSEEEQKYGEGNAICLLLPAHEYDISTPSRKGLGRCFANARGAAKNENYLIEKLVLIHVREKRFVSGFQGDADPVCGSNDVELH